MSKIVITNSQEFENIIKKIEKSHQEIVQVFQNEKNNMESINETDTWSGKAQTTIYCKYKQLEQNFAPIDETLQIYIQFLKTALKDYKELEENFNNNIDSNLENLNVNS